MAGTYENQVSTDPESFFSVQERRDSRDHWRPVGNSRRPYTEEFRNELVTNACLWHEATGYDYRIVRTIREVEFET